MRSSEAPDQHGTVPNRVSGKFMVQRGRCLVKAGRYRDRDPRVAEIVHRRPLARLSASPALSQEDLTLRRDQDGAGRAGLGPAQRGEPSAAAEEHQHPLVPRFPCPGGAMSIRRNASTRTRAAFKTPARAA